MESVSFKPIGIVHTPFTRSEGTPIQTAVAQGIQGSIEVFPEFEAGLADLDGFSHIILLFYFHLSKMGALKVTPFLDTHKRGVFATRSPNRPNPIGLSVVKLIRIQKNILTIEDVDILDGTPLLDIKPYIPAFDVKRVERIGWIESNIHKLPQVKDDGRFT